MEKIHEQLNTIKDLILKDEAEKESQIKRMLVDIKKHVTEEEYDDILTYWVKYQHTKHENTHIKKVMDKLINRYNPKDEVKKKFNMRDVQPG